MGFMIGVVGFYYWGCGFRDWGLVGLGEFEIENGIFELISFKVIFYFELISFKSYILF